MTYPVVGGEAFPEQRHPATGVPVNRLMCEQIDKNKIRYESEIEDVVQPAMEEVIRNYTPDGANGYEWSEDELMFSTANIAHVVRKEGTSVKPVAKGRDRIPETWNVLAELGIENGVEQFTEHTGEEYQAGRITQTDSVDHMTTFIDKPADDETFAGLKIDGSGTEMKVEATYIPDGESPPYDIGEPRRKTITQAREYLETEREINGDLDLEAVFRITAGHLAYSVARDLEEFGVSE